MAIGAIAAFKERNIIIPQDISIIGFDNIVTSAHIKPGLTTIGQSPFNMGKAAVRSILDQIKGKNNKREVILDSEIIIRESCSFVKP